MAGREGRRPPMLPPEDEEGGADPEQVEKILQNFVEDARHPALLNADSVFFLFKSSRLFSPEAAPREIFSAISDAVFKLGYIGPFINDRDGVLYYHKLQSQHEQ